MFRSVSRAIAATALLGALVVGLTACGGGGGASKEEIAAAEQHGREVRAEKEKERLLRRQIQELREGQQRQKSEPDRTPAPPPNPAPEATPELAPSPSQSSCGGSLSVGPDTSCGFAENVRAEYEFEIGSGSGTVFAYSEANNEDYEMFCTAAPHECSGAIDAKVYFP